MLIFVCAGIYPYVIGYGGIELSRDEMAGAWTSATGAILELAAGGTAHMNELPGDVWSYTTAGDLVEIDGRWQLCRNLPNTNAECDHSDGGRFFSLQIVYDVVFINGRENERDGGDQEY